MSAPGCSIDGAPVALCELLLAVRRELVVLHGLSVDAQAVLGEAVAHGGLDAPGCRRAQVFDLISQRLDGLAAVLSGLAETVPAGWRIDPGPVVADVTLSALVRMVAGPSSVEADAAMEQSVELF